MTSITFFRENGRLTGFRASGHAGMAEAGEDIVCAAVSALCETAVLGLQRVAGLPIVETEADALLDFRIDDQYDADILHDAQVILRTLEEGLIEIKNTYPAYVRVIHRERRQKS